RRVDDAGARERGATLGALGASPAVADAARVGAGERQPERQVAAQANHGVLGEPAKGGAYPDRRAEGAARAASEIAEETRGRVGEGVVGEERESQGGNPGARAVDGGEASEEEIPSRQVVGGERRACSGHAPSRKAPVLPTVERRDGKLETHERRESPPAACAERAEETSERGLLRPLPREPTAHVDGMDPVAPG